MSEKPINESNPELERLTAAVQARAGQEGDAATAPLLRLARALTAETPPSEACERCRTDMPAMAEAELRGERLSQLFRASYAHLDICEECALQYAEILDMLMEMEAAAGLAVAAPPPALPPRMVAALRIRDWVSATVKGMMQRLRGSAGDVEMMLGVLVERLPQLSLSPAPLEAGQFALAFGAEDEETPLLLATWFAAEKLADAHTVGELQSLAQEQRLTGRAKEIAEATARQLGLPRATRKTFVEQFVASATSDPAAFIALGRPD